MKHSDIKYIDFVESLPEVIFELDRDGVIIYINSRGEEILGLPKEELLGMSSFDFVSEQTISALKYSIIDYFKSGMTYWFGEFNISTRNYEIDFPVRISASPVKRDSKIVGMRGIIFDISMRRSLEDRLRKSEERFRRLSDTALEAIVFHDSGIIFDANKAFTELFGYELDEIVNSSVLNLALSDYHEKILENIRERGSEKCEAKAMRKNGDIIDIEFFSGSYRTGDDFFSTVVMQDITERKRYEYLQNHDELTGLLNYKGFLSRLDEEILNVSLRNKKLAILTIHIKDDEINILKNMEPDLDRALINTIPMEIAERLKAVFFKEDSIGRIADNEYISFHLLPGKLEIKNSVKLINKALGVFSRDFVKNIHLDVHAGITFYPDDYNGSNAAKIINNSRYSCKEAKLKNREYMFYDEKSHLEMREGIDFVKDLAYAVKIEKCCNFILHYQPKVTKDGTITGMEALIRWKCKRWNCPDQNIVMPDRFIKAAEELGLISEIGNWVIKEACSQTREWQLKFSQYRDIQGAVNVSPSQLTVYFPEFVSGVLERTGLPPGSLELEITERETVKEENVSILEALRGLGISIAIDDFGIDYSSLSKLPKLAIDTIKLDKSYIDEVANDSDYEKLVNHTIQMVHCFNYRVVAEGVENIEQVEKLFGDMGCDKIQGFYFYKPMAPEDFEKKLMK